MFSIVLVAPLCLFWTRSLFQRLLAPSLKPDIMLCFALAVLLLLLGLHVLLLTMFAHIIYVYIFWQSSAASAPKMVSFSVLKSRTDPATSSNDEHQMKQFKCHLQCSMAFLEMPNGVQPSSEGSGVIRLRNYRNTDISNRSITSKRPM